MATVRVHELAKELNLSSKDTIALLGKVGIRASTHMSVIDEHRARIVKGVLRGDLAEAAKTHKTVPKKAATAGNGAPAKAETAVVEAPERPAPPKPAVEAPAAHVEPASPVLRPVPPRRKAPSPIHHKIAPAASADPTAPAPAIKQAPPTGPVQRPGPRPVVGRPGIGAPAVGR